MESMEFFEELINNYSTHFRDLYGKEVYPNQSKESCHIIYELCVETNPDYVIEMGTNYGASTIALAMGLKKLGKSLSDLLTMDLSHEHWTTRTPVFQGDLLKRADLNINVINTIQADFSDLDPNDFIKDGKRVLVFYDMHDHDAPHSLNLLNKWVPLIKEGIVAVHDMSKCSVEHPSRQAAIDGRPRTSGTHFSGQAFSGFGECVRVVEWLNNHRVDVCTTDSSCIYFKIGM